MNKSQLASKHLLNARQQKRRIESLPPDCRPATPAEAYDCQDALISLLSADGPRVGYKIACTNPSAQKLLNLDGPFFGRLLKGKVHQSPCELVAADFFMRVIEAEFAFEMGEDLPRIGAPYDVERVRRAIKAVLPAIEIVDSRFTEWTTIGAPSLIADNACAGAWVYGPAFHDWRGIDFPSQGVKLFVNGKLTREGSGAAVLGNPLNALTWLVNALAGRGHELRAGELVTTGITTEVYLAQPGDQIVADFGSIGTANLRFAPA